MTLVTYLLPPSFIDNLQWSVPDGSSSFTQSVVDVDVIPIPGAVRCWRWQFWCAGHVFCCRSIWTSLPHTTLDLQSLRGGRREATQGQHQQDRVVQCVFWTWWCGACFAAKLTGKCQDVQRAGAGASNTSSPLSGAELNCRREYHGSLNVWVWVVWLNGWLKSTNKC